MSIKLKFGLVFFVIFFIVSVLGIQLISLNHDMDLKKRQTSFAYSRISLLLNLKSEIQAAIKEIYDIVVLEENLIELKVHKKTIEGFLKELENNQIKSLPDNLYEKGGDTGEQLRKLKNEVKKIVSDLNELASLDRKDQKKFLDEIEEIIEEKFENEFSVFLNDMIKGEQLKLADYSGDEKIAVQRIELFTLILLGVLFIGFLAIFLFVAQKLVKPILELEKSAEKISQNDFDIKVNHKSNDEVGKLYSAFLSMSRRIEKNVGELKTLLASIVESSEDAIIGKDLDDRIISWNKGAENLLGYSHEEAIGMDINRIMPEDKRSDLSKVNAKINSGQPVGHFETQRLTKDNRLVDVSLNVSPIRDHNGNVIGGSAIVRDITFLKQAQRDLIKAKEEAEQASQAKSEFLSRMSHELRTPMNAILGFGQLLRLEIKKPNPKVELTEVDYILKAGKHLLELINDVLDLSRIESGSLKVALEPVDLMKLIDESIGSMNPIAEEKSITIINNCQKNSYVYVVADGIRLKQIVLSLLSNAIIYNRVNGTVSIAYEIEDRKLKLNIVDTGIGISQENQKDLFKPFERFGTQQEEVSGVGIGLSICKKLVELFHGSIYFKSVLGKGSTFTIELPLSDKPLNGNKNIESAGIESQEVNDRKTILYIEDNPANLKLVQLILKKYENLNLMAAPNAQLGIEMAKVQKPHLILLDIHLPGMDGFTAFKRLKTIEETSQTPVVAVTSDAMEADKAKALEMGFLHHISKPLDVPEFLKIIHQTLEIKE